MFKAQKLDLDQFLLKNIDFVLPKNTSKSDFDG